MSTRARSWAVSARCFSLGLQQNRRVTAAEKLGVIHSFDEFVMRPWWGPEWFAPGPRPEPNDDVFPIFEKNLGPLLKHVTVHKGEMADQRWDRGPIEILFLDICKTVEANDNCSIQFFPHLIPGASAVDHESSGSSTAPGPATGRARVARGMTARSRNLTD